jgi:two-component system cell cycle sensor histidine kinase/response regulator CckA
VRRLIHESVSPALRGSDVHRIFDIPAFIHAIEAYEGQISQAFNNIIKNAVQAVPGGGTPTVHAGNVTLEDENGLGLQAGADVVWISVPRYLRKH